MAGDAVAREDPVKHTSMSSERLPLTPLFEPSRSPLLPYATIVQLDIRVGTILTAEHVPHSKKLIALQVDVGEAQTRCILTGSKPARPLELFAGRQVPIACNVPPRELAGMISQGVMLSTYDAVGGQMLLVVAAPVPVGTPIR
jgi:methionyl-tRNA synthetase